MHIFVYQRVGEPFIPVCAMPNVCIFSKIGLQKTLAAPDTSPQLEAIFKLCHLEYLT